MKHSIESIKKHFKKEGYELLSKKYINNKTKLKVICPEGHDWCPSYFQFQQGNRCLYCSGKKKHSYSYIKEQIEKENYRLLSKEYKGAFYKLYIQCDKGHEYYTKFNNFQQGQRCMECYLNSKPYSVDYVKNEIKKKGYKLLSKNYVNCKEKLLIECNKGHKWKTSYNSLQQGSGCPTCWGASVTSKMEKEVLSTVKDITNEKIIPNERTLIKNPLTNRFLELDIWIPSLKKAIEFNGEYWHNSNRVKKIDRIKKDQCRHIEIDLLIINEKSWKSNEENCVSKIRSFINEN